MMSNLDYNQIFRDRTKKLCILILKELSVLKYSEDLAVIRKQIYRSSTSVAANYRAVGRARSEKEKFAKLCVVVEEVDETQFWLEVIEEMSYLSTEKLNPLKAECDEIVKVMTTYKKKLQDNLPR
ncbi:four helix bundle protein [Halpernia frigidisoli]|uniref:Four helix bundle protein n=1 Tax=Halpernia frigidisoli TaxID=1125876 RepID=A0A1I3DJ61_9FLAO|nr:four helix bundle protein [Halpernia frigidisoli]SFH86531.1 four helix bundle protein [Halpernia frigidisoli]